MSRQSLSISGCALQSKESWCFAARGTQQSWAVVHRTHSRPFKIIKIYHVSNGNSKFTMFFWNLIVARKPFCSIVLFYVALRPVIYRCSWLWCNSFSTGCGSAQEDHEIPVDYIELLRDWARRTLENLVRTRALASTEDLYTTADMTSVYGKKN